VDARDFLRLSKALKDAGDKEMRKKLHKAMKDAVKPVVPKARARARATLPSGGGLNKLVASSPIRPQVRTGRNKYGVSLVVGNRAAARAANKGKIRHPTFGHDPWKDQSVPSGWFDDVCDAEQPAIKRDVQQALRDFVLNELPKGVK
jgi:hypothetical protein